jgi:hypothetical protein
VVDNPFQVGNWSSWHPLFDRATGKNTRFVKASNLVAVEFTMLGKLRYGVFVVLGTAIIGSILSFAVIFERTLVVAPVVIVSMVAFGFLVSETETTIDTSQRLIVRSYRILKIIYASFRDFYDDRAIVKLQSCWDKDSSGTSYELHVVSGRSDICILHFHQVTEKSHATVAGRDLAKILNVPFDTE